MQTGTAFPSRSVEIRVSLQRVTGLLYALREEGRASSAAGFVTLPGVKFEVAERGGKRPRVNEPFTSVSSSTVTGICGQDGGWCFSSCFFPSSHCLLFARWRWFFPGRGPDLSRSLMLVIALLLASWIMTRFVNQKPLGAIGVGLHPRTVREFVLGWLLGFLMMAGIFLIQCGLGYLSFSPLGLSAGEMAARVAVSALFFLLAAAGEELMFRGYFFQTLMQAVTFPAGRGGHVAALRDLSSGESPCDAHLQPSMWCWRVSGSHSRISRHGASGSRSGCMRRGTSARPRCLDFPRAGRNFRAEDSLRPRYRAGMDYRGSIRPGGRHPGDRWH